MQNKKLKNEQGITLVALIITIIILIILSAVVINLLTDMNIVQMSLEGTVNYSEKQVAEMKEFDNLASNLEDVIGKISNTDGIDKEPEPSEKGDKVETGNYIKYDVEYKDMYIGHNYTADNGWRLLNMTDNGDGTYSNVELISTGIPLLWDYYNSYGNADYWWVTDQDKLNEFKSYLEKDGEYKLASTDLLNYNAFRAAAGFYYNFKDSILTYGFKDYNQGRYTYIKNGETVYDSNISEALKAGKILQTEIADNVRIITLPEINKKLERNDPDSLLDISSKEDPQGLYNLSLLKNVPGISAELSYYNGQKRYYWLASPHPAMGKAYLCHLNIDGSMNTNSSIPGGLRPVISIKGSKVIFNISEDGNYYNVKVLK